jgi:hypothetical protein
MGMLLACTSLVANAVVSGQGSLAPRTAAALPEPFPIQGAATGPHPVGVSEASTVATATALASSDRLFIVPGPATGHRTDGTVAPSGADSVEPIENPVADPPGTAAAFEPVREVPGDEPERQVAPVLQPVTELLAQAAPSAATGVAEVAEPALSML